MKEALLKFTVFSCSSQTHFQWECYGHFYDSIKVSWSKSFFLVTLCTQTMLSVLVFMCRDPGDATSKVSCCVQTSYCFKNRDFDANVKVPVALPLKMSLT